MVLILKRWSTNIFAMRDFGTVMWYQHHNGMLFHNTSFFQYIEGINKTQEVLYCYIFCDSLYR